MIFLNFLTSINFGSILFSFLLIFIDSMMSMPLKRKEPVPSPPARENSLTIFYMLPEMMEIKAISVNCNVILRKALNTYFESGCCMSLLRYFYPLLILLFFLLIIFLNFCYLNNTPFSFSKMTRGLCYQLSSQDLPLTFCDEDIYSTADSYCDAITSYFISIGIKMS